MRILAVIAILITLSLPASAQRGGLSTVVCSAEAEAEITSRGIPRERLNLITIDRLRTQEGVLQGRLAWFSLEGCTGSVVVEMTGRCLPVQSYTRGDCKVPGLPGY